MERLESNVEGYVHHVCTEACPGLKRTSELQKLELQADVSHHVDGHSFRPLLIRTTDSRNHY